MSTIKGENIMFDYHMHSSFSADCSIPMEEMVQQAIRNGLTEICFTEHIDYEYPDKSIVFDFDKQKYTTTIEKLRAEYGNEIIIKKGVEIGVQPHILSQCRQVATSNQFDFIICSLHTLQKTSLHYKEIFQTVTAEKAFQLYYDELFHCIQQFQQYSVLGHVDLIKRYSDEFVDNPFHDVLTTIFNEIIPAGKGIELNTSGFRYGLESGMPSEDILRLYKQCGGEILTLGSDAHRPSEIAFHFRESLQLIQSIGFTYIATFDQLQPSFHKIDTLL